MPARRSTRTYGRSAGSATRSWAALAEWAHRSVLVEGEPVGAVAWSPDTGVLSLLTLNRHALALDRQVMEYILALSSARTAYVASWDAHHIVVFGAFASTVGSQAYQFRLLDISDLREPLPGLKLRIATSADLDYLESTGWQQNFALTSSRAR